MRWYFCLHIALISISTLSPTAQASCEIPWLQFSAPGGSQRIGSLKDKLANLTDFKNLEKLDESSETARTIPDVVETERCLNEITDACIEGSDIEGAEICCRAVIQKSLQLDDYPTAYIAMFYNRLAYVQLREGQLLESEKSLRNALADPHRTTFPAGSIRELFQNELGLAEIAIARGNTSEGKVRLTSATQFLSYCNWKAYLNEYIRLAHALYAVNQLDDASHVLTKALSAMTDSTPAPGFAVMNNDLAAVMVRGRRWKQARHYLITAINLSEVVADTNCATYKESLGRLSAIRRCK